MSVVATGPRSVGDGSSPDAAAVPGLASPKLPAARTVGLFCGLAVILWLVVAASAAWLPLDHPSRAASWAFFPGRPWFGGWVRFDGGWYRAIALDGYSYHPGHMSSVAFFPSYPILMRAVGAVTGNVLIAGISITVGAGLSIALLFGQWATRLIGVRAAWTALILFLVYPYSLYFYGAVYSDALFVAAALGAFVLLERGHPALAGLVGIVALAGRPVGVALVLGLAVRAVELRNRADVETGRRSSRFRLDGVGGVFLALLGLGGWCGYLWARFGDPFVFAATEGAWHQEPGPRTWFKLMFFGDLTRIAEPGRMIVYLAHPIVTVLALALVPIVWRRLGRGYGVYTATVLLIPAISTTNFWSMGRYALAAFPCFAAAALVLTDRTIARRLVIAGSTVGLIVLTMLYARGVYVA